jgi:hypothetical protein
MRTTRQPSITPRNDSAVEQWLRRDVATAYDAIMADPSRGRSLADVRASLAAASEQSSFP